jgi:hypothetical protein
MISSSANDLNVHPPMYNICCANQAAERGSAVTLLPLLKIQQVTTCISHKSGIRFTYYYYL